MEKANQTATELHGLKADLDKAIFKGNATDCLKLRAKLEAALDKCRGAIPEAPAALQECFRECEQYLGTAEREIERVVILNERNEHLGRVKPLTAKISAALEKGDGEAVLKAWRELQGKMQPLLDDASGARRFANHPEVEPLLAVNREYAEGLEAKAEGLINYKTATEAIKKCAKVVADMKAYLTKEDGESALKQWKYVKDYAKPLCDSETAAKYEEFEETKQFLAQYRVMEQTVEAECDRLIRLRAARAIIKKGQALMAELEKATAKCDGVAVKKHYAALEELSKPLADEQYHVFEEVNVYLLDLAKLEHSNATGDAFILNKEMDDVLTKSERLYKEVQSAISVKDGELAQKKWRALQEAIKPFTEDVERRFQEFPQVAAFLEMYEELGKTIDEESASLINLKYAISVIAKCAKLSQEIEDYEKKGDGDSMLKIWKKLEDTALPLTCDTEVYSAFEEVRAFTARLEADRPLAAAAAERHQRLRQAQALLKPLRALADSVQKGLSAAKGQPLKMWSLDYWTAPSDGQAIQKLWTQLKEKAAPVLTEDFSTKYGEFEEVQAFLKQYSDMSARVEGETEALIREKEGKRLHAACQKLLDETKAALGKSQGEAAKKAWTTLWATAQPLVEDKGRFDPLEYVQDLKRSVLELKSGGVEEEIRVLINRNTAQAVIAKCQPLIDKVDKAYADGKPADARKHFKALETVIWVLVQDVGQKFGGFEEVVSVRKEWERLRERVEGGPPSRVPRAALPMQAPASAPAPTPAPPGPATAAPASAPPASAPAQAPPPAQRTDPSTQKPPKRTQLFDDLREPDEEGVDNGAELPSGSEIPDAIRRQLLDLPEGKGSAETKRAALFGAAAPARPKGESAGAAAALKQQQLHMPEDDDDDAAPASTSKAVAGQAGARAKRSALFDSDEEGEGTAASAPAAGSVPAPELKKGAKHFDSDDEVQEP